MTTTDANKTIAADLDHARQARAAAKAHEATLENRETPSLRASQTEIIEVMADDKSDLYAIIDAKDREIRALRTALRRLGLNYR